MARSLNKVMLIGNCAAEPEVRSQQETYKLVTVTVATNERKSDGNGGWKDQVEWHRVIFWNQLADTALQYLHKGSRVYIEGRLRSNSYPDRNHPDVTHRSVEINADTMIMLDSRRQDDGQGAYTPAAAGAVRPNGAWGTQAQYGQDNPYGQAGNQLYGQQGMQPQQTMAQPQAIVQPQPMQSFNNFNNQNAGNAFNNFNNGMAQMNQAPQANGFAPQNQAAVNTQPAPQAPQNPPVSNFNNEDIPF